MKHLHKIVVLLLCVAGCIVIARGATVKITEPKEPNVHYIAKGEDIQLICRSDGNPTYQWLKDGVRVRNETRNSTGRTIWFDSRWGYLIIKRFDDYFNGDYVCLATVGSATSVSQTQTLRQISYTKFHDSRKMHISAVKYGYGMIPCANQGEIVGEKSDVAYHWITGSTTALVPSEDRLFIDEKGNLHFTYVLETDDKTYICAYTSKKLRNFYLGNDQHLRVTDNTKRSTKFTRLMYNNGPVVGEIGSDARLECFFSGYDELKTDHIPWAYWSVDGVKIINSTAKFELSEGNRVMKVKNLQETDDKYYRCKGFTNTDAAEIPVYLNVTSRPIWIKTPKSMTRIEGEDAEFHCDARSAREEQPPGMPTWYINGRNVGRTIDSNKFVFSADKKTLTVKRLNKASDIMCVQCYVSNSVGTTMGEACVDVISSQEQSQMTTLMPSKSGLSETSSTMDVSSGMTPPTTPTANENTTTELTTNEDELQMRLKYLKKEHDAKMLVYQHQLQSEVEQSRLFMERHKVQMEILQHQREYALKQSNGDRGC